MDHAEYLRRVKSYIKVPTKEMEEQLESFCSLCTYVSGQYDQDESFINLNNHLEEIEKGRKDQNRIFYMALPPSVFITVSDQLKRNCYPKNSIARIIVSAWLFPLSQIPMADNVCRLKNHSVRISEVRGNCRRLWNPTGRKRKSSVSIITWARRWLRTFSFSDSVTSSLVPPGTVTTLITFRYDFHFAQKGAR